MGTSSHVSSPSQSRKEELSHTEPKTEQEKIQEAVENLPQGGQAVLETAGVVGSGELQKIAEKAAAWWYIPPRYPGILM